MGNRRIEDSICEAIQIIADKTIAHAGFDKTIRANIVQTIDATTGEYKVKYQDSEFTAKAADTGVNYQPNAQVLVLIPGNDWDRPKTILNGVNLPSSSYKDVPSNNNTYNINGPDLIKESPVIGLCSYRPQTIILYECNYQQNPNGQIILTPSEDNQISINQDQAKRYIRNANDLLLKANFRTALDDAQTAGQYGLIYTLVFYDNVNKDLKEYEYILSNQNVQGNPYLLNSDTLVSNLERDVDNQNFVCIKQISAFVYGFPYQNPQCQLDDIFISNININGADALTSQELNNDILVIQHPDGDTLPTFNNQNSLILVANIKSKGVDINRNTQDIKYYWFIENASIFSGSSKYCGYAGEGWQCLNPLYGDAATGNKRSFIASKNQYTLTVTSQAVSDQDNFIVNVTNKSNKILCVAVYGNNILKNDIIIINTNATQIYIDNNDKQVNGQNKQKYYLDNGNPTLTCKVGQENDESDIYYYQWTLTDHVGKVTNLNLTTKSIVFPIKNIKTTGKVSCAVTTADNNYLGTGSITLINSHEVEGSYSIDIINGTQVFQYNGDGISPANSSLDRPINILPLSFIMVDNTGKQISYNQIKNNGKIKWYIPKYSLGNTMLKSVNNGDPIGPAYGTYFNGADQAAAANYFDIYYDLQTFNFAIDDVYDSKKDSNYIKLEIYYKDLLFEIYTNLTFAKDGDPGTNGTEYVAKINTSSDRIYYNKNRLYDDNNEDVTLIPQLWHNGQLINSSSYNVTWKVLKNKNDFSFISIGKNSGNISPNIQWENKSISNNNIFPCSIIRAQIEYNNQLYYAEYPIVLIEASDDIIIRLKPYSGFKYAVYTSDGRTPDYDDTLPFEIIVQQYIDGHLQDVNINTVQWIYKGVQDSPLYINGQNNDNLQNNKRIIRPLETFNGQEFNHGIKCQINNEYWIWIPIYKLLNRYGISALNGWDGNSIEINENEDHILAPQIGAGKKNNDNTFTGVFMGEVKNGQSEQIGFMGYHEGGRTIFLDAQTGKAQFGKAGSGKIILDPSSETAKIRSGNYQIGKSGMEIDLTTPYIKFGSGNFAVNEYGHLTAKGGGQIAGWRFNDNKLYSRDEKVYIKSSDYDTNEPYAFYSNGTFSVTPDGKLSSTAGDIAGWKIESNSLSKDNIVGMNSDPNDTKYASINNHNAKAFFASDNFYVTHDGYLKSVSGNIAGWSLSENSIYNYYNSINHPNVITGMNSDPTNGDYVVQGHLSKAFFASDKFFVTHDGYLESTSGKIGGWTIGSTTLTAGHTVINSNGSLNNSGGGNGSWSINNDGSVSFLSGSIGGVRISNNGLSGNGNGAGSWYIYPGEVKLPGLRVSSNGVTTIGSSNGNGVVQYTSPRGCQILDNGSYKDLDKWIYQKIAAKFLIGQTMKARFITFYSALRVNPDTGEILDDNDPKASYGANLAWLPAIVHSHSNYTGLKGTLTFSDNSQLVFENGILIGVLPGTEGAWSAEVNLNG